MLNVDSLLPITANAETYEERCKEMVRLLASEAGKEPEAEIQRFCRIMGTLRDEHEKSPAPQNALAQLQNQALTTVPNVVEFVLTYAENRFRGFGYLTQGKPSATLPLSLSNLLASTFKVYLSEGGTHGNAELLADLFALTFPNLNALESHSPMAQGMLLGFVPREDGLDLKLYFNTRLGVGGTHRERVNAIFDRLGVDGMGYYDRIYEEASKVAFHGLGIDLSQDESTRLKIYVRIPRKNLETEVRRILTDVPAEEVDSAVRECQGLISGLEHPLLADDIELAIGIKSSAGTTLKCTAFFITDESLDSSPVDKVTDYVASLGYDTEMMEKVLLEGARGVEQAVVETHPVHGVGIELGKAANPKVNLYLRPLI